MPDTLLARQSILRDVYAIGSILTLPLALISTVWIRRGDPTIPLWAMLAASSACALAFICYVGAIFDLTLIPRRYSLMTGTKRRAYEKLLHLDDQLRGIVESMRQQMTGENRVLSDRDREEMRIDFAYFLTAHVARTKRSLLGVVTLSMLCIIMSFASVYIAIYSMQPEGSVPNPAAARGGVGWVLYGLECSLENVTSLGKHSESSPLAKLSAITESVTFFFLISVILSVFLDLSRETAEITPDDLARELERDLSRKTLSPVL